MAGAAGARGAPGALPRRGLVDRRDARRARRSAPPRARPTPTVNIWSESRPWHGTYAEIHADALRLVTALADAGLEPGDVVAFQLPNWREAVVAFYGLAMGGYVLVPIVHIYGPKEVRFILGAEPRPGVHLRRSLRARRLPRHRRRRRARRAAGPASCTSSSVGRTAPPRARVRRVGVGRRRRRRARRRDRRRRPRRRVRARVHVGHDERPEGRDAQPPHAARRVGAHAGVDHARMRRTSWARRSRTRPACSARCSRRWSWARTST